MTVIIQTSHHSYAGPEIKVSNVSELVNAVEQANRDGGNVQIVLDAGTYTISQTLNIKAAGIIIRSASGDAEDVIIEGDAMAADAKVGNVLWVAAPNFTLDGITVQKGRYHAVQFAGELGADNGVIRNSILRDVYEQIIKVSSADGAGDGTNAGLIENSQIYYSAGIAPNWYTGGIDIHNGDNWIIQNNYFANIASPSQSQAEHAIHIWNGSEDNIVRGNVIVDSDRGIGFGMQNQEPTSGGEIYGNTIYNSGNPAHAFADVGIILENNAGTKVYDNTVVLESGYSNAIEVRFAGAGNEVYDNTTYGNIRLRQGGEATLSNNTTDAEPADYRIEVGAIFVAEDDTFEEPTPDPIQDPTPDPDPQPDPDSTPQLDPISNEGDTFARNDWLYNKVTAEDLADLADMPLFEASDLTLLGWAKSGETSGESSNTYKTLGFGAVKGAPDGTYAITGHPYDLAVSVVQFDLDNLTKSSSDPLAEYTEVEGC